MDETTRATWQHIGRVREIMNHFIDLLHKRAYDHDQSKLKEPELSLFAEWGPKLSLMEYGSEEYKAALENMGPALQHHYEHNSHHPEHFEWGYRGMDLFDILEMLADWKASQDRVKDGSMENSFRVNVERFEIEDDLAIIIKNTLKNLNWLSE